MAEGLTLAALAAALTATGLCALLVRSGLMDLPRLARSAHAHPTPTSGGLAMGAGLAAGLIVAASPFARDWAQGLSPALTAQTALVALAAFAALAIGFIDDLRPLGPVEKFAALAAGAVAFAVFVARAESFPVLATVALDVGVVLGVIGSALWLFTMVNATNFMDGANGLAMGATAIGLFGLAATALLADMPHVAALALTGAGAMVGFLVWNFPRARLFAGDSGSLFAGALAAGASLALVQEGGVSPLVPPILFFPILADVLLTLAWRVSKRRPRILDGHRDHMFQIAIRAGLSHAQVSLIYWAVAAHCALIAILASLGPRIRPWALPDEGVIGLAAQIGAWLVGLAPLIALIGLALISIKVHAQVRRFAATRGLDGE